MTEPRPTEGHSVFVSAPDGLRIHVRCHGPRNAGGFPVLCLPGLTRTAGDFTALAQALAAQGRRVLSVDYRGRGQSDRDPDPSHYSLPVELGDVLAVQTALAAAPAIVVGTSRGGILAMLMGAARPTALAGIVLNDIGPVIEPTGLARIKGYVGKVPEPRSFEDGAQMLKRLHGAQFPAWTDDDWLASAKLSWEERGGRLVLTYDPQLARALDGFDLERPLPPLWREFDSLARLPLMVIRGANSDLLSAASVGAMRARRPDFDFLEIAGQGHAPSLDAAETIGRIAAFCARCDAASRAA